MIAPSRGIGRCSDRIDALRTGYDPKQTLQRSVRTLGQSASDSRQLPCYSMSSPGSDVSSRSRGGQRASVRRRYKARFWFTLPRDLITDQ
jgi:hypothetical protein